MKAKDSEVDSEHITEAKEGKKMMAKAPKKKSVPRKKSEDDLAKWETKRKAQKKTVVSKIVTP